MFLGGTDQSEWIEPVESSDNDPQSVENMNSAEIVEIKITTAVPKNIQKSEALHVVITKPPRESMKLIKGVSKDDTFIVIDKDDFQLYDEYKRVHAKD